MMLAKTLGEFRRATADMGDDAPLLIAWADGHEPDSQFDPAVRLFGVRRHILAGVACPEFCVGLVSLEDISDEEDE
jgi:hypothetical protein